MLLRFDTLGILDKATTFDRDVYERNRHRSFLVWSENDLVRAWEVAELALRHGRSDIARIIEQSVERSKRIKSVTEALKRISWRAWDTAYRRMSSGMMAHEFVSRIRQRMVRLTSRASPPRVARNVEALYIDAAM